MLYILPETTGDILVVQATGKLTQEECLSTLDTHIAHIRQTQPALRLLLYLDADFTGFALSDAYQSLGSPERVALVSDPHWQTELPIPDTTATAAFTPSQFLAALHWLNESEETNSYYPFS